MRVFWPQTGIDRNYGLVVGWRVQATLCVVGLVDGPNDLKGLQLAGTASYKLEILGVAWCLQIPSSSSISEGHDLQFWINHDKIPISCSQPGELVLYSPPDLTRLRFLRTTPPSKSIRNDHLAVQDDYGVGGHTPEDDTLQGVLNMINMSKSAQRLLLHGPEIAHDTTTTRRYIHQLCKSSFDLILRVWYYPLSFIYLCARTIYAICDAETPLGKLRCYSSTIDQISLRLSQRLKGPERFKSTRAVDAIEVKSEKYIQFWNVVWLIFNDVILGYSARQFILLYASSIQDGIVKSFDDYLIDMPITALKWLNDWPVGLKLNTPLSQFFCTGLGSLIQGWGDIVGPLLPVILPALIRIVASLSMLGLTFTISFLKDSISILTAHFYLCHVIMRWIFDWQLESLSGLWNLFRGKRWNVLRKRTDSYEYDVDQLFLGTLLFTVSAFLFPTVLTYFELFALIRIGLIGVEKGLGIVIKGLNSFPLFELMLRVKEPSRLPAGIHFKLRRLDSAGLLDDRKHGVRITHVLELKNSPKSLSDILFGSHPTS
ncbi:uncharacterized protein I303_102984 [Kwoniella dejecticola CBS 10117]|uniref:Phosphatidylinositol glycan, class Q n=1 Tax=Kwoniella dejecticola CBS 10117 TaxID=1296121 RepID=A0A1A6AA95_9TREE|nr:uncharacterized protein I303_03004 [Kwoniella dejecticola CBS 10117]OBR86982.1 hypothetical protein I303_03004 [Kwoniella dejecticola CBS 10117]